MMRLKKATKLAKKTLNGSTLIPRLMLDQGIHVMLDSGLLNVLKYTSGIMESANIEVTKPTSMA